MVCPFGLIYNDANYYLVAFDTEAGAMRHYRVDKIAELGFLGYPFQGAEAYPNFNLATYAQRHFGMFSGEACTVTLRCDARMSNIIIDRFGRDVILVPQEDDSFTVQLPVVLSPQFFGWLFGLGDEVVLVAPPSAVAQYSAHLNQVLSKYL